MDDYLIRQHLNSVAERVLRQGEDSEPPSFEEIAALFMAVSAMWERHLQLRFEPHESR